MCVCAHSVDVCKYATQARCLLGIRRVCVSCVRLHGGAITGVSARPRFVYFMEICCYIWLFIGQMRVRALVGQTHTHTNTHPICCNRDSVRSSSIMYVAFGSARLCADIQLEMGTLDACAHVIWCSVHPHFLHITY